MQRQFKARIDTLITRNTVMGGYSHKHFVYKGVPYTAAATPPAMKKNRLVPALRAYMEEFLCDRTASTTTRCLASSTTLRRRWRSWRGVRVTRRPRAFLERADGLHLVFAG